MTAARLQTTRTPEETFELARELVGSEPDCPAFYLTGELGAGKTVFAKGIAAACGVDPDRVSSPTFALVNRYSGGRRLLYHLDLYRIETERELEELGIEELEEEGALLMIEWAEKLGRYSRPEAIVVAIERLESDGDAADSLEAGERRIRIEKPTPGTA